MSKQMRRLAALVLAMMMVIGILPVHAEELFMTEEAVQAESQYLSDEETLMDEQILPEEQAGSEEYGSLEDTVLSNEQDPSEGQGISEDQILSDGQDLSGEQISSEDQISSEGQDGFTGQDPVYEEDPENEEAADTIPAAEPESDPEEPVADPTEADPAAIGAEPTEPVADPIETEATEIESNPSAIEAAPAETESDPTEPAADPAETEADSSAIEAIPAETVADPVESETAPAEPEDDLADMANDPAEPENSDPAPETALVPDEVIPEDPADDSDLFIEISEEIEIENGVIEAPAEEETTAPEPEDPENPESCFLIIENNPEYEYYDFSGAYPADPDDLLQNYFERQLFGAPHVRGSSAGSYLEGNDLLAYNYLKAVVAEIAAGNRAPTEIEVPLSVFGIDVTKPIYDEDLDISGPVYTIENGQLVENSQAKQEADAILTAMYDVAWQTVINALFADCPYDLYWSSKTAGYLPGSYSTHSSGVGGVVTTFFTFDSSDYFYIYVAADYQGAELEVDMDKTGAASQAAANALQIVTDAAAMSDYDKLVHYKEAICDRVTYDDDARIAGSPASYGSNGPWQVIWVFDNDTTTNVVCEGYSKAFKYLCDLTSFANSNIYCITVTGDMDGGTGAGSHMWNIVTMDDGKNYLVDVTNCDDGSVGCPDYLFLAGTDQGSVSEGYLISCGYNGLISYSYDPYTMSIYSAPDLTIATTGYNDQPYPVDVEFVSEEDFRNQMDQVVASGKTVVLVRYIGGESLTSVEYGNMVSIYTSNWITVSGLPNYNISGGYSWRYEFWDFFIVDLTGTQEPDYSLYPNANDEYLYRIEDGEIEIGKYIGESSVVVIPSTIDDLPVKGIGYFTFSGNKQVTEIMVSEGIEYLMDGYFDNLCTYAYTGCFSDCTSLQTVYLPASLERIGNYAFSNCSNLTQLVYDPTVSSLEVIGEYAFRGCSSLSSMILNEGLKTIDLCAFEGCTSLTQLTLPASLESFYLSSVNQTGINSIYIPANVNYFFGRGTIYDHDIQVTISPDNPYLTADGEVIYTQGYGEMLYYSKYKTDAEYHIPEGCQAFPIDGQNQNPFLKTLYLSSTVELLWNSDYIKQYIVSEESEYYAAVDGVLFSKDMTVLWIYPREKEGKEYSIPDTVTEMQFAFWGNQYIETVYIPASVVELGYGFRESSIKKAIFADNSQLEVLGEVFRECSNLELVVLPEGLQRIASGAFHECYNLKTVILPDSLTVIESGAFTLCTSLGPSITIPESVYILGNNAFINCTSLEYVFIPGEITYASLIAFEENVTIVGQRGSFAEQYASDAGLSFLALDGFTEPEQVVLENVDGHIYLCSPNSCQITIVPTFIPEGSWSPVTEVTIADETIATFVGITGLNDRTVIDLLAPGTTTITIATASGQTAQCQLTVDELEHQIVIDPATVTCTAAGLTEGSHCGLCHEVLTAQEEVPALGHTLTKVEYKPATTTAPGNIEYYKCTRCGELFRDAEGKNPITAAETVIPKLPTGWVSAGGKWYYYNADGVQQKGIVKISGKYYYFNETTGECQTGWKQVDGKWYYFDPSTSTLKFGWILSDNGIVYFDQATWNWATGWYQIDTVWYCFDSYGVLKTGWILSGKDILYFDINSWSWATGWKQIDKMRYYFSSSCVLQTSWFVVGSKIYYFDINAWKWPSGWYQIGKMWYYFNSAGVLQTGWIKSGSGYLYFDVNAWNWASGWKKIDGVWCYFDPTTLLLKID